MTRIMLIDAAHAEETRVAVVDGARVEEFDFESRAKKQLRGNIYLAKITRVEPSLQAAFVEYGGNRHGFLAFNEIHPDYYQIPVADREALLAEEAEENAAHHAHNGRSAGAGGDADGEDAGGDDDDDVMEEEAERRRRRLLRRYKIQEVIKRRQIMLVQVVKDERGAKGASLTTYLSLAGRYCVLMPNTARGGGISRKIASAVDRKRLKGVIQSLAVPEGMGLIVRTAGAKRTKAEIKRDYEYLLRLWEDIRAKTLKSIAPALIYEEEDLVKRAIRDMYDKDVDGIVVEGEDGYREAREFMRMLMPSQAKKIQPYREAAPLFVKYKIEDNLAQIYSPVAPLKSGGYLVINQTEALVAIDVNSGKSTRERGIEATALKTNMEAAEEAARQLRLRDLAGLIVIDFIDMDEAKNNRLVEKKLKDSLKDDRARIQMGKISSFGLMELSRQRRRTGVLEGTTHVCPHCNGVGRVRSPESSALAALRAIEIEAAKRGPGAITLRVPNAVGLYILNEKRLHLAKLQEQQHLFVSVQLDDSIGYAEHQIERTSTIELDGLPYVEPVTSLVPLPSDDADLDVLEDEDEDEDEEEISDEEEEGGPVETAGGADENGDRRGRGRRRRRGRRGEGRPEVAAGGEDQVAGAAEPAQRPASVSGADEDDRGEDGGHPRRRRRRGRRGGRRGPEEATTRPADSYTWTRARTPDGADPYGWYDTAPAVQSAAPPANDQAPEAAIAPAAQASDASEIWVELPAESDAAPKARSRRGRGRTKAAEPEATAPAEAVAEAPVEIAAAPPVDVPVANEADEAKTAKKPRRTRAAKAEVAAEAAEVPPEPEAVVPEPVPEPEPELVMAEPEPRAARQPDPNEVTGAPAAPRRGWWRRGG